MSLNGGPRFTHRFAVVRQPFVRSLCCYALYYHCESGSQKWKLVPLVEECANSMSPRWPRRMRLLIDRPNPVPSGRSVRKESKISDWINVGMPLPLSLIVRCAVFSSAEVSSRIRPPSGMACVALSTRLSITWRICPLFTSTWILLTSGSNCRSIFCWCSLRRISLSVSSTSVFRSCRVCMPSRVRPELSTRSTISSSWFNF